MDMIVDIRNVFSRVLNYALLGHVVLVGLAGLILGNGVLVPLTFAAVITAVPLFLYKLQGSSELQRQISGVSLVLFAALLVFQFRGHPWQIDVHMYFFAVLAVLAAFCDFKVIVVAAGVVAVHHLGLNFIMPTWIFPEGADFWRVVLHATVVILEVPSLIWLALKLNQAFESAADAQELAAQEATNARTTAKEAEGLRVKAEEALQAAEEQQQENTRLQEMAVEEKEKSTLVAQETREEMAAEFEASVVRLLNEMMDSITIVSDNSENLMKTTDFANQKITAVSEATTSMSGNVDTVAASIEEMSSTAKEISAQVMRTATVADNASTASLKGKESIDELANRSTEIRSVIQMINDIAEQTNLLALNATIEAARAGEAGKGFAVVAHEVKSLATQSSKATEEIEALINTITDASADASKENDQIVKIIEEVKENSASISAAVEEQSATTAETARAAQTTSTQTQEVQHNTQELVQVVADVRSVSELTAAAVEKMMKYNEDLKAQSQGFIARLKEA